MARHELRRLAGIVETNTTILKAQHGDRNGMVNACRFPAKTGGPARANVLRLGKRVGLWRAQVSNYKIPAIIDYQKP
jgi:hypothetical protein